MVYDELGYFFIGNSYPYVDLTNLDAAQVSNDTDRKIDCPIFIK